MDGNFIKEWISAAEAIKSFEKGNANNINDAARGKYNSTYNYQWRYKQGKRHKHNIGPCPKNPTTSGTTWTEERRIQYKKARKGEKRSKEYSEKISKLKQKSVYQFDQNNKLISIFPSFSYFNKDSGIIGTTKLRKIINKNIYYNEYRYSYTL